VFCVGIIVLTLFIAFTWYMIVHVHEDQMSWSRTVWIYGVTQSIAVALIAGGLGIKVQQDKVNAANDRASEAKESAELTSADAEVGNSVHDALYAMLPSVADAGEEEAPAPRSNRISQAVASANAPRDQARNEALLQLVRVSEEARRRVRGPSAS
jgi:hypothetical protein